MCLVVALQNSEGASRDHFGPPAQLQVRSARYSARYCCKTARQMGTVLLVTS